MKLKTFASQMKIIHVIKYEIFVGLKITRASKMNGKK